MDNLDLRQRFTRSMIRVTEHTQNIRRSEKFQYCKYMTNAFMEMLELQNKMDAKLDVLRSLVDTAISPEDRYITKECEVGLIDFDTVDATMQSYFSMLGHCVTRGLQKWIERNIIFKCRKSEFSQEVNTWT